MKYGVCIPNYGSRSSVNEILDLALTCEKLNFDSIWMTDHLFISSKDSPYRNTYESLVTLSYVSAVTRNLRLGISSLILSMRNVLITAKQLATIDVLSKGRLILAVASGWNEEEFTYLGYDFHNRGRRLDEAIRTLRELWNGF